MQRTAGSQMNPPARGAARPRNASGRWQLRIWCDEFEAAMDRPWHQLVAADLFSRMEELCAYRDVQSDEALAEVCAEMTVFLCKFALEDVRPDAGQRARLERLLLDLRAALVSVVDSAIPAAAPTVSTARKYLVHYVRPRDRDQLGLAAAFGQERIGVLPLDDVDAAMHALAREHPDVVLLDGAFLKSLQQLAETERRHNAGWRRTLWIATGIGNDVHLRLHARRNGIDLLLEEDEPERAAATLLSALLRRREQSHRVLLVEEDRSQATFCTSLLRHQGFELDLAETAAAARELLRQRVPDLILLDINLPDMSGIELAQLIREQDSLSHVPIVFLTGEEGTDVRVEAMAAGGDDFLSKPVRPRHLIATVNSRVGRARALEMASQSSPLEEGVSPRLDRLRFVEAMHQQRQDTGSRAAVVVLATDAIGSVAAKLGFVRTGDLALQIGLAIEAESNGLGRTCGLGEFSHMVLLEASSEHGLRQAAEGLRSRLEARGWLSSSFPLKLRFSASVVRYDGSPHDADAVIAEALGLLDTLRREGSGPLGYRSLVPEEATPDPMLRIVQAMLSKPLGNDAGRLQFRALMPLHGTCGGQFLLRTLLIPPRSSQFRAIAPDGYAEVVSSLNAEPAFDRLALRLARAYEISSAALAEYGWSVLLPVSEATLKEPLFPDWLQREGLPLAQLRLVVRAQRLRAGSGLAAAIDRIAQRGWHWVLQLRAPQEFDTAALSLPNLDALLLDDSASTSDAWNSVIEAALLHGKTVIAVGADNAKRASALFMRGVHYALGDWTNEPQFDATRPSEA